MAGCFLQMLLDSNTTASNSIDLVIAADVAVVVVHCLNFESGFVIGYYSLHCSSN